MHFSISARLKQKAGCEAKNEGTHGFGSLEGCRRLIMYIVDDDVAVNEMPAAVKGRLWWRGGVYTC